MNILIVSHGIPSNKDPQWGCFEMDQAKAFDNVGHKVTLVAIDGRFRKRTKRGVIHTSFGRIDAYSYYLFPFRLLPTFSLRRRVQSQMMTYLFKKVIRMRGKPDVIYAHYLFIMELLSGIKAEYPSIPIIGIEHWSKLNQSNLSETLCQRGKDTYGMIDRLLAVSPALQRQIKKHFERDSEVVYNMVDDCFFNVPINNRNTTSTFVFASCGSLLSGKGFDLLIKAFSRIDDKKTKLIIIGDGPEKDNLLRLCKEEGVEDRVSFKGRHSREEIVSFYKECSAFVLASHSETFGVAYIEALAMGIPVIATRCGGPESFMNLDCGYLVDVGDVNGLVEAMNRIQSEYGKFSSQQIREYVRSRFSGNVVAKQLEAIFEEEIMKKKQ